MVSLTSLTTTGASSGLKYASIVQGPHHVRYQDGMHQWTQAEQNMLTDCPVSATSTLSQQLPMVPLPLQRGCRDGSAGKCTGSV